MLQAKLTAAEAERDKLAAEGKKARRQRFRATADDKTKPAKITRELVNLRTGMIQVPFPRRLPEQRRCPH